MKFTFEIPDGTKMDPAKVRAMLSRGYLAFQHERLKDQAYIALRPLGAETPPTVEAEIHKITMECAERAEREEKAWREILMTLEMVP